MTRVRAPFWLGACVAAGSLGCAPAPPAASVDPAAAEAPREPDWTVALDRYMEAFGSEWGPQHAFSGVVVVADRGVPVYARGFGGRDETGAVPDLDTQFRIGSLSKSFTAAIIGRLAASGALRLDDSVRAHLPELPPAYTPITLAHLLAHRAGVPDYTADASLMSTRAEARTTEELLASFVGLPLEGKPGDAFAYSNSGYVLLGAIIERLDGGSYGESLARLSGVAGLEDTRYGWAQGENVARGHVFTGTEHLPAPDVHHSFAFSAGGISSTAADLVRWDEFLRPPPRPLAEAAVHDQGYVMGWFDSAIDEQAVARHAGGIDGFACAMIRALDRPRTVIVWTNRPLLDPSTIATVAFRVASGARVEPVAERRVGTLPPSLEADGSYALTPLSETYLLDAGADPMAIESVRTLVVRVIDDHVELRPAAQDPIVMFPAAREQPSAALELFTKTAAPITARLDVQGDRVVGIELREAEVAFSYARAASQ